MKKLLSIVVVLLLSSTLLTAQKPGISIGGNAFFPAGDWAEFASTGWGGSVTYEHPLGRNIGGVIYSGYTSFSGDSGLDWTMVPLLVGAKFYFSPKVDWYFAALLGVNFVTANTTILECSRKRPIMLLTRMFSDSPFMPGRRQQIPRITKSISTPAFDAL